MSAPTEDERVAAGQKGMLVALWAAYSPQAVAVIAPSGERTFKQLNDNANRLARALGSRGLVAGDAVALMCGNRPEFADVSIDFVAALPRHDNGRLYKHKLREHYRETLRPRPAESPRKET